MNRIAVAVAAAAILAVFAGCTTAPPKPERVPLSRIPAGYTQEECHFTESAGHTNYTSNSFGGAGLMGGSTYRERQVECKHPQPDSTITFTQKVVCRESGKEVPCG
jgi:hypothetical protein